MYRADIDPAGKGFLLVGRLSAIVVSIRLSKGSDPHLLQGQHSPVGIRYILYQNVGPKPGRSYPCFPKIGCGLLNDGQHGAGIAGQADESYPVETSQQFSGLRRNQAGIQPLVEIHPYLLAAHAVNLLQAMPGGQHIVVQKDNLSAVWPLYLLPGGRRMDIALLAGNDAPGT